MISICIPSCKDNISNQLNEINKYKKRQDCKFVLSLQKQSAAKNRNYCIDNAHGEIIVMMDDDITGFYSGWLDTMLSYFTNEISILSIRPIKPDGSLCPILGDNNGKLSDVPDIVPAIHSEKTGLNIVGSACIMFKKTHIRFDENYNGATYEDTDFAMQHLKEFPDKKIMICNRIKLIHKMEAKGRGSEKCKRDNWIFNHNYFNKKWNIKKKYGFEI